MAVESKGIFTKIDNMLMELLTEATDNTSAHSYCALAAQLRDSYAFILNLWQDYVSALDLSPLVIKNR